MRDASSSSTDLVLRVNEVFHDVEGAHYDELHAFNEGARWRAVAERITARRGVRVLDLGTGTGYVAQLVGPSLTSDDTLICADLSAQKLAVCEQKLRAAGLVVPVQFVKLDGHSLPIEPVDHVLMNAVIHHVPDLGAFFRSIDAILRPGGTIVLAHEPNQAFHQHRWLATQGRVLRAVSSPKTAAGSVLRRLGLLESVRRVVARFSSREANNLSILRQVNSVLLREGAIQKPLTQAELTLLVDVHAPGAGGSNRNGGLDVDALVRAHLPGYSAEVETYGYGAAMLPRYERFLAQTFPAAGAMFSATLRKPG